MYGTFGQYFAAMPGSSSPKNDPRPITGSRPNMPTCCSISEFPHSTAVLQ
jgi:hypothetical protein